eukprot:7689821-Karenia_brevis.AAC.1
MPTSQSTSLIDYYINVMARSRDMSPCSRISNVPSRNFPGSEQDAGECTYCGVTVTAFSRAQSRSMRNAM